jgi:Na+/proline symporter
MNLPLFGIDTGIAILAIYGLVAFALTYWYSRGYNDNKTSFLVARRELNTFQGSLSLAAAWLWAPGLFISTQQAYQNGLVGLFWFCIGNFLTLLLFAYFAKRLRQEMPAGFTFSGFIRERFSNRVQNIYIVEMMVLAVCAFAINILAGSKTVETLTGIPYQISALAMALIALTYSFRTGLKATVVTEIFKILVVWTGVIIMVPAVISAAGGWETVVAGLGGIKGDGADIFGTEKSWMVFATFGAAAFLGHLGGPWGDNSFYQRTFAIRQNSVMKSFIIAAFVFGIIPVMMGLLGFVAAGTGMEIPGNLVSTTNAVVIAKFLPAGAAILFVFIVFAGLVSILDSQFASVANMTGHDIYNKYKNKVEDRQVIKYARIAMVALCVAGLAIAFIPGITLLHIFLFFATLRAAVWLPSMFAIVKPNWLSEQGMFWGILIAIAIGLPLFVYGNLNKILALNLAGTLIAIFGSIVLVLAISQWKKLKS